VRRGEPVRAADGDIGRVQGLLIDSASHQVTHLLREVHPSGRRDVAIPVSAVAGGGDGGIGLGGVIPIPLAHLAGGHVSSGVKSA
jgi:hypothetical protein